MASSNQCYYEFSFGKEGTARMVSLVSSLTGLADNHNEAAIPYT